MADSDLPNQIDGSAAHYSISNLVNQWRDYLGIDTTHLESTSVPPHPGTINSFLEEVSNDNTQSHDPNRTYISDQTGNLLDEELTRNGFELHQVLSEGGMATVYRAIERLTEHEVAIKVDRFHQPNHGVCRESCILRRLNQPRFPKILSQGQLANQRKYLVMPYLPGANLSQLLRGQDSERQDIELYLDQFQEIAFAIGYAHALGIVHRDLKPSNIMCDQGTVTILDWGLAKDLHQDANRDPADSEDGKWCCPPTTTVCGAVLGTPSYMAPEQARGEVVDRRVDVYALGGILHFILTGRHPNRGNSCQECIRYSATGDLSETFAGLDQCGHHTALIDLVKQCLAPRAEDRPANGYVVAKLLVDIRESEKATTSTVPSAAPARGWLNRIRRMLQLSS